MYEKISLATFSKICVLITKKSLVETASKNNLKLILVTIFP
jgi:hypothetical protein